MIISISLSHYPEDAKSVIVSNPKATVLYDDGTYEEGEVPLVITESDPEDLREQILEAVNIFFDELENENAAESI